MTVAAQPASPAPAAARDGRAARRGAGPALALAGERAGGSPEGAGRGAPVVVLTYGHAGAHRLQALLADQPELACTSGTGLLAACEQAATAWRQAEVRPARPLSALATASVRALATGMIATITARAGRPRWCETAAAIPAAADTFLGLFPATRFLCLHRACPDVAYAVLQASPWGLSGPAFASYTTAHPASTAAALAAWWAGHTAPMLAFEQDHPGACLRIRYEDLAADPNRTERDIRAFLSLGGPVTQLPEHPDDPRQQLTGADAPGRGADFPAGQLPAPLLAQVNRLQARLGYPPLKSAS